MAVVCPPVCPSACPVPGPKLKMELRSKLKIGGKETHAWWPVIHLKTKRSKVKVTRPTNAELECAPYTVATRPWKLLKVLEKIIPFFQGLESPWKWNRALKVLEFDVRGPWKSLNFNTSPSSLPRVKVLQSLHSSPMQYTSASFYILNWWIT